MTTFLVVLAVFFAAFVGLGVYAAVRATKAIGRKVDKALPVAQRKAEGMALKARALAVTGPVAEVVQLRIAVRTSMEQTRKVLESGVGGDSQLGESVQLLDRLDRQAQAVDRELAALEKEQGGDRIGRKLPELRERVGKITAAGDKLRFAAQDRQRHVDGDDLDSLTQEVELEAGALRHWSSESSEVEGRIAEQLDGQSDAGISSGDDQDRKRLR